MAASVCFFGTATLAKGKRNKPSFGLVVQRFPKRWRAVGSAQRWLIGEQAERMPSRIEVDAQIVPWLVAGERGAHCEGMCARRV